ncbi:MIF4G like-domain-containing protein [Rhypophila decipiens]|uniref:MIF4G like-domain-containing protein n=1 Tax=Rhypophila decipiens TaxID=261697 RepID=A0AAN6Y484_9PEZI|nr:MIF4G like-domain-containing protein [Rhypophila decipiens]
MADYDRRSGGGGGGGGYNGRKRQRYRDDHDDDRRGGNQRRRLNEAPPHVRVRKQLLNIAENPMRPWHEEVKSTADLFTDNWEDERLRANFVDLVLQLSLEQPLKSPFLAAVVLVANLNKPEIVDMLLAQLVSNLESRLRDGEWRDVKLYLKLLACLQSCLEGEGVFPVLEELFARAVDLQTASSEDTIGTELVKIILLTLPYVMVSAPDQWQQKAADLMDKTEIIASEPHTLQALIEPYHAENEDDTAAISQSLIGLLQSQLQNEANNGWALACLPRPWEFPLKDVEMQSRLSSPPKHTLPPISVPQTVVAGPRPLFPEVYFSVYREQDVESVPPVSNAAASLIRDALLDTINVLDYNRHVPARQLIEVDCFFAPRTFAPRATPFDLLRNFEPPKSTWKPEDVAVDAVFSQLFQLPNPEHKLVYFHSVLTEACKLAPAAIAPSLGRAIRYFYRNNHHLDLELVNRFMDWFSHHLSNFGFTWKWTEWVEDVDLPDLHPSKAFIRGAIDKEIRLSFAQRIKNTLPEPYQALIGPEKEKETPDFKFADDKIPFAAEGREIATLLRKKASDEEIQPVIERIHAMAIDNNLDPLVASTHVFVTSVLHVGSKSLSHVLAAIERTKDRLTDIGASSEAARSQILTSVMEYWSAHSGVAITIVEKLLNYSILSPSVVINWALVGLAGKTQGEALAQGHIYELTFNTVMKVTGRVRQLVNKRIAAITLDKGVPADDAETAAAIEQEVGAMRSLFKDIEDALVAFATGTKDEIMETTDGLDSTERERLVKRWGERWLRVYRRRSAIEEAYLIEREKEREKKEAAAAAAAADTKLGETAAVLDRDGDVVLGNGGIVS